MRRCLQSVISSLVWMDDIAVQTFEKQVQLMEKDNLDLLGGHDCRVIDNPDEIVSCNHVFFSDSAWGAYP